MVSSLFSKFFFHNIPNRFNTRKSQFYSMIIHSQYFIQIFNKYLIQLFMYRYRLFLNRMNMVKIFFNNRKCILYQKSIFFPCK